MEADTKEPSGVTRGQNAVHVLPADWSAASAVLSALVDRIDTAEAATQLLVVSADAESAASAAAALVSLVGEREIRVLAASSSPRAARLLRVAPAHIVVGAPAELVTLMQGSALKAASVRGVLFAWLDAILGSEEARPLETLMGELPKEGARVLLAAELTPAHEELLERYARRARREVEAAPEDGAVPLTAEYVTTAPNARAVTLRRLLDALDLPQAEIFARTDDARREALAVVRALGYPADAVRAATGAASNDPLVLVELPASREELRVALGTGARRIYAVVQPTQLRSLRSLLGGGQITPVALIDAAERARGRDAALRASLRELLTEGDVRREVLALEPLLAEFDGIEVAAAALRLLEQQRPQRSDASALPSGPMTKLFVNVGEKDGVHTAELVATITREAGIPGSQIGKVEVRDTHSIVEIAGPVAELVAGKITGSTVRGRKLQARLDQPRDDRPSR
ncbi:MAG: DbpA RNA binding domain-containing protein, partial [Gemmatimonadaceae bacterium]|nr:DbpA RNA binding domain-containing protein [Gemmatimonadaceae bacterium]